MTNTCPRRREWDIHNRAEDVHQTYTTSRMNGFSNLSNLPTPFFLFEPKTKTACISDLKQTFKIFIFFLFNSRLVVITTVNFRVSIIYGALQIRRILSNFDLWYCDKRVMRRFL